MKTGMQVFSNFLASFSLICITKIMLSVSLSNAINILLYFLKNICHIPVTTFLTFLDGGGVQRPSPFLRLHFLKDLCRENFYFECI